MISLATLYFPAGVAIGIGAAAPVGPVNLLVIERTLSGRRSAALLMGLAAALGDACFAIVAAFGLGAIGRLLEAHEAVIRIVGGLVMLGFAIVVWRSAPHLESHEEPPPIWRGMAMTASMTITNPATLLFFLGSIGAIGFSAIGHDTPVHRFNAGLLVTGVLAGSMLWWLLIAEIAARLRGRVSDRHLRLLNRATAAMLALFGVAAIAAAAVGLANGN